MKTIFEQLSTSDSFYMDAKRAFIQGRESSDPELDFVKYSMETILALCLALAAASNKHNSYLGDHSNSVGNLAGQIAKEMGYSDFEAIGIMLGGYIHDIGKIAIPTSIILKPNKLSHEEYELIKTHTTLGWSFLHKSDSQIPYWNLSEYAKYHHERLDGMGYPDKLIGIQIPMGVQIVAVSDVYHAATSHRPYNIDKHESLEDLFESDSFNCKAVEIIKKLV
jgi:HD-GYP domain-containing protein (c-di-GMP phosphodiesterase class II)